MIKLQPTIPKGSATLRPILATKQPQTRLNQFKPVWIGGKYSVMDWIKYSVLN